MMHGDDDYADDGDTDMNRGHDDDEDGGGGGDDNNNDDDSDDDADVVASLHLAIIAGGYC